MNLNQWQIHFRVEGLVAPKGEKILRNDLIIKGSKERDDVSEVHFKISREKGEPTHQELDNIRNKLKGFLQIYGLVAGRHAWVPDSMGYTTVDKNQPFGKPKIDIQMSMALVVREEQWEKYTSLLELSVRKYYELESLLESRNKRFLRNAIDYYYRSLNGVTPEEELIDLLISLESLLSSDPQELRFRLSLRTCLLLGRTEKEKREIFDLISALYKNRSDIVHKGESEGIKLEHISKLKRCVKKAILSLIYAKKEQELVKLAKTSEEKWVT